MAGGSKALSRLRWGFSSGRNSRRIVLHCAHLDCHAFNVVAVGTNEGVEVEIRRFGYDATQHHRDSALRARATLNFMGC